MNDLNGKSIAEMLALHAAINEELRSRNVLRSANNPTGDLAEYLFCTAFGWEQEANSKKGFDAADSDGVRYQIVNRRSIGTPYRRAKGTPLQLRGLVDAGRVFRAAGGVGRA